MQNRPELCAVRKRNIHVCTVQLLKEIYCPWCLLFLSPWTETQAISIWLCVWISWWKLVELYVGVGALLQRCESGDSFLCAHCTVHSTMKWRAHRVHRVANAAFWRIFHHEGKISPGWWEWGGGASPPPFITFTITSKVAMYAPAERALGQIQYTDPVSSLVKKCTLWVSLLCKPGSHPCT